MDIEERVRKIVADVLKVERYRVVLHARLELDLLMYSPLEAELAFMIEKEFTLRRRWWKPQSRTFGDLVADVREAMIPDAEPSSGGTERFSAPRQECHAH